MPVLIFCFILFIINPSSFSGDEQYCDKDGNCYYSPGNPYTCYIHSKGQGNCTWWAYYKRSDLAPSTPLNAIDWFSDAISSELLTGQYPVRGSLAVFNSYFKGENLGHVAFVEDVYNQDSFLLSEMGYEGWDGIRLKINTSSSYGGLVGFIYGNIGRYADGWHNDGISQAFLDVFIIKSGKKTVGLPTSDSNGRVHKWGGFWTQDFTGGSDGAGVIMYNPVMQSAFWVHENIYNQYH